MIELSKKKRRYQKELQDPIGVKIFSLKNGLKLYMSVNENEPRIHTNIVVRAGSKHDPSETTGLAHYMEHMLFKGTSKIGALNWEKEKVLLDQISDLYEQHRKAGTEAERLAIYSQIDRLSYDAAKLIAPNEYDKLASALGAAGTNAYTWVEQTVYVNDIPANELERWMKLESERFRMMALRLFHTELETVYEEFNINQDLDFRKTYRAIRESLFPKHPYGTQTTIGEAEHLKNPSQVNIQRYFNTYYVPNNMAIALAGDFDPDEVVSLAEKYFGAYQTRPIPPFHFEEQPESEKPVHREVFGQEAPYVEIAWRLGSSQTDDPLWLTMLSSILHNQQAGLLDIHLNQNQKVLEAEAWVWYYEDYSVLGLYGKARDGQSLEEVEQLLLEEVEKIKKGEFDEWLMDAIINDLRLNEIRANESNPARVQAMTYSFILGLSWKRYVDRFKWMKKVSKQQLADFAKNHLKDNYVVVYKRQRDDHQVVKVDKPPITPVELKREALSDYAIEFLSMPAPQLQPQFADFEKSIHTQNLSNGLPFDYVWNRDNELFRLDFIFEMGKNSDPTLALAVVYLQFLGTDRYSASDLQKEFFRLGLSFDVQAGDEKIFFSLSGLDESLEEGMMIMEHIFNNIREDEQALENVISDTLVKRENAKKDKEFILRQAMANYAKYGRHSPFTNRLSNSELKQLKAAELVKMLKGLPGFEHRIYYYGPRQAGQVASLLEKHHKVPSVLKAVIPPEKFKQVDTKENKVCFLDFPMVQVEVLFLSKGTPHFNLEEHLLNDWYNEYFGYGLSSVVFQEIRESMALAYSTYAYYSSPRKKDQAHYLQAFAGTQPDKLTDAVTTLMNIIENMPVAEAQIEQARRSILKRIESERLPPSKIYWEARDSKELGYNHDLHKDIYKKLEGAGLEELKKFHETYVKGRAFTFLVLGSKESTDLDFLKSIGKFEELDMETVFGY